MDRFGQASRRASQLSPPAMGAGVGFGPSIGCTPGSRPPSREGSGNYRQPPSREGSSQSGGNCFSEMRGPTLGYALGPTLGSDDDGSHPPTPMLSPHRRNHGGAPYASQVPRSPHGNSSMSYSPPASVRRQTTGDDSASVIHTPGRGAPTNSWSAQRGMGRLVTTPTSAAPSEPQAAHELATPALAQRGARSNSPPGFILASPSPRSAPLGSNVESTRMEHRRRPERLVSPTSAASMTTGAARASPVSQGAHGRSRGSPGRDAPAPIGRPNPQLAAPTSQPHVAGAPSPQGSSPSVRVAAERVLHARGLQSYQQRFSRSGNSTPSSAGDAPGDSGTTTRARAASRPPQNAITVKHQAPAFREVKDPVSRPPALSTYTFFAKSTASMVLFFTHWFRTQKSLDWNHDGKFDEDDVRQFLCDFQGLFYIQMSQPKNHKSQKRQEECKVDDVQDDSNIDSSTGAQSGVKRDVEEAEEDQIIENCRTAWPWFVSVQVLFCGMLWLYWAIMQRPYDIKLPATSYAEENTMTYQLPDDGNQYSFLNGEQISVDYCEYECNKYDGCLGFYFKHTIASQCVLLSSFPAEACDSNCASEYDAIIYEKATLTVWNFVNQPGGLDNVFPEQTTLRIHGSFCEDYSMQVYRLFTYQFTHTNMQHILSNSFGIIFFGTPLELSEGTFYLFLLYQAGVIGGGLCTWLTSPHTNTVGSSGGAYALIGMHIADMMLNWKQQKFRRVKITLLMLFPLADIVTYALGKDNSMSHSTQVGGIVTGLLAQLLVGQKFRQDAQDKYWRFGAGFAAFVLSAGCVIWYFTNPFPGARSISDAFGQEFIGSWCWVGQACLYPEHAAEGTCPSEWQCIGCADRECVEKWYQFAAGDSVPPFHVVMTTWAACRDMTKLSVAPPSL